MDFYACTTSRDACNRAGMLMGDMERGQGISILIDVGEVMDNGAFEIPIYPYRNFPRRSGLTVEQSLAGLGRGLTADIGVQIADPLLTDCVRLCCSLCLLENDPEIISQGKRIFRA